MDVDVDVDGIVDVEGRGVPRTSFDFLRFDWCKNQVIK